MCGRYTQTADSTKLAQRFHLEPPGSDIARRYNIAPTQDAPIIANDAPRRLRLMRWGLIPSWAKDETIGNRMINARAETLAEKPSFKKPLERRRCLVPADGFYEWRKSAARAKIPVRIVLKSREPFAFAGLWDLWRDPEGREVPTFAIITTAANELLKPIHDRMPVILRPEDEGKWVDPKLVDPTNLIPFLKPYPAVEMESYEVSPSVNSPSDDSPNCIAPLNKDLLAK